jgi:hypothetical protein
MPVLQGSPIGPFSTLSIPHPLQQPPQADRCDRRTFHIARFQGLLKGGTGSLEIPHFPQQVTESSCDQR